ncbi:MAG: AsmA-like C-terminal region-containing protein [Pseudomonadota bacterium]
MTDQPPAPAPRRRTRRRVVWTVVVLIAAGVMGAVSMSGQPVTMPGWAVARMEDRLNRAMGEGGAVVGQAVVEIDGETGPQVELRDVRLSDARGVRVAALNRVRAQLSLPDLLRGDVAPKTLQVSGAQITIRRAVDGGFTLSFGDAGTPAMGDAANLLDAIDAAFADAPLADIGRVEATDLTISLEDARSGRVWQVTDGSLVLVNDIDSVGITVTSEVFNGTEDLAQVQLSFLSNKGSAAASIGIQFENAAAADIALQAPALSYLGVIDAPVSGSIRTAFDADGAVDRLAATLEIDSGALRPAEGARAIPFNSGRVYATFDPADQRLAFSELRVQSDAVTVLGEGHAYLRDVEGGWPQTLVGQMRFEEIALTPEDVFDEPVVFDTGVTDIRMRLDPFEVDIGQSVLLAGADRLSGSGTIGADDEGWRVSLDMAGSRLTPARLIALWPRVVAPKARVWLQDNVQEGELTDIAASIRVVPGAPLRAGLSYDFQNATVRYMPHMPLVTGGAGHAALIDRRYAMRLEEGQVRPAGQRPLDLAGSTLAIIDVAEDIPLAELNLRAKGPLAALLTALDNRPFQVLEKSGRTADLAAAEADVAANVVFRLAKDLPAEDVAFDLSGTLTDVSSDSLVPGRVLSADRLELRATAQVLEVAGPANLDGIPLEAVWRQPLGRGETSGGQVTALVPVDTATLAALGINLPPGTFSGRAEARVDLDVPRNGPATFALTSDLRGARLRIPDVGWDKPSGIAGELSVAGTLGPAPQIDRLRLAGAGLAAEGSLRLGQNGAFVSARLDRLRLGDWLDGPATVTGRGPNLPPTISITGGTIDLRALPDFTTDPGGEPVPLQLAPDRLILADGIALRPFRANVLARGGLDGRFEAQVNGGVAVRGALVPQRGRTAVRVLSEDAGAVFRDAGLFRSLTGGAMDLILTPKPGRDGFDGQMTIRSATLRDQPAIADLLDAVSVIGMIDQLQGPGILFNTIDGRFDLMSEELVLRQGAAVGASLGLSLDGTYDLDDKELDMRGVISPIYLLNAVGQVFTRRGEGLFGFTYTMTGSADAPRMSVNPLSVLAPGFLREIFRGGPPGSEEARQRQIPKREERREQP